ncbi:fibronectin type III domain-containing protein [Planctomicrobium sp. SH668]|uniref:fibronectin type III domain-containing protein n=1 Tax=Planctomicrobium sp. SH668 TaxID=3448126 RepID=UPI003F5B452D
MKRREFLGASLSGIAAASALDLIGCNRNVTGENSAHAHSNDPNVRLAPDTLILTWQKDPTTTMTFQWLDLDTPANGAIYVDEVGKDLKTRYVTQLRPYQKTDHKLHRLEVEGLQPNTDYQFRVSGTTEVRKFRTMPSHATDTIQWVSGGDCGTGSACRKVNAIAAMQDPRFALIGGDLAYDNGKSPDTFTKFLRNYHSSMVDSAGRTIPMITCIGNHEVEGVTTDRSRSPQYLSFFDGFFPERTYGVLDIGDYLSLVLLDTGHLCPVAGEQTDWLESALKDRADRQHLIVAGHVPAYPSYRVPEGKDGAPGTGSSQRKHWCPLFEKYKVDLVLEHHDHTFKRTHPLTDGLHDKNGVLYLGDGSWGQLRPLNEPELRPYLARVSSANHITVHRLEGDDRFHVALDFNGQVADVCHTFSKRASRRG